MSIKVAVCIATFRRPEGLARLLQSLDALHFERVPPPDVSVFIIDNDREGSPAPERPQHLKRSGRPLIYCVEPQRGLSRVRNAALDAVPPEFEFIAFVDDDEWVEPDWLDALLAIQQSTGCAVVQGVVLPVFEGAAKNWMRDGHFYEVGPFAPGEKLQYGATGNCLLVRKVISDMQLRFDARFNLSGGEDVAFFHRVLAAGHEIIAAPQAIAYETVPVSRISLGWLLRRRFRTGHSLGLISIVNGERRTERVAKAARRVAFGMAQLVFAGPFNRTHAISGITNLAWGSGTIAAFFDVKVDQYGAPDGE